MRKTIISIAIIITCHNRKAKTLRCLDNLFNQSEIGYVRLHAYLVDDGSTDATGKAVLEKFPQVNLLQGDGNLYWNGGMRFAFAEAMKHDYDYYLWLNDDTFIYPDTLKLLIDTFDLLKKRKGNESIIVGTIKDINSGLVNYSGYIQKSKMKPLQFTLLDVNSEPQLCDTFNGNVVLISRKIAQRVGNMSHHFSKMHSGDLDYGLRAKYAGFESWVAPGIAGECASNKIEGTIYDKNLPMKERIRLMKTPHGLPPAKEWMIFTKRHTGFLWPFYWARTIIRVIFPRAYLLLRKPQ